MVIMLGAVVAAALYKKNLRNPGQQGTTIIEEPAKDSSVITPQESPAPKRTAPDPVKPSPVAPAPTTPAVQPRPAPPDTTAPTKKPRRGRFGYVSVKASGVRSATVYIDGKKAGQSPLVFHRIRQGRHTIKVVEGGGGKRSSEVSVNVAAANTRKAPLRVIVPL